MLARPLAKKPLLDDSSPWSCTLWIDWAFQWTYYEVYLHSLFPTCIRRHLVLSAGYSPHGVARVASASPRENSACVLATWILRLLLMCGHFSISSRAVVDLRDALSGAVSITTTTRYKCSKHGCRRWIRCSRAADRGAGGRSTPTSSDAATLYMLSSLTLDVASDVKDYYREVCTIFL